VLRKHSDFTVTLCAKVNRFSLSDDVADKHTEKGIPMAQSTLKFDSGVDPAQSGTVKLQNANVAESTTKRLSRNYLQNVLATPRVNVDLAPGDRLGPYRVLSELGHGGMGTVFLAEQKTPVQRRVALKVIKLGMDTREVIARFDAERQAIALMSHPNVAAVLDAGATRAGRPYFVMEFVPGVPITDYCDEHRLDFSQRLELFIQACEGIQHAHHKGIIHRDIKPGNVLVTEKDGRPIVKVIDFGVAKSTQQKLVADTIYTQLGTFIGTPNYTSPEQATASVVDVDTRADVYSLGVMLYELLVGKLPFHPETFSGKSLNEIQRIIRESDPPRPTARFDSLGPARDSIALNRGIDSGRLRRQLKGDIAWIALCAMEKDRNRRYPSAFALAADIRRFLANEPILARPPSAAYKFRKFARRHVLGVAMSILAVTGLMATSTAMTGLYLKAREAEIYAQQEAESARQVASFLTQLFEVSDPNISRGEDVSARDLLDRGAVRIRSQLVDQPLVRARLMRTISGIYEELGFYTPAETLGNEALAQHEALLDPDDPEIALSLNNLGNIHESQGNTEQALLSYRRALDINEQIYGSGHPAVSAGLSDLGGIMEQMERYPEAMAFTRRALVIDERTLGPDHPQVASDLSDLGNIDASQGRFDSAIEYHLKSLAISRTALGEDHADTAGVLVDLGIAYLGQERYQVAETHLRRALVTIEKAFGPNHPDVAEVLDGLGETLIEQDRLIEAEEPLSRALAIRQLRLGSDHEETRESVDALAELYVELDGGEPSSDVD
jgi:serine/threonine protein kinase